MKSAQIACRAAWVALGLKPVSGWQRQGAHDQCRSLALQTENGTAIATVYPSGLWAIYEAGNILAEGMA
jgi:hypothetical protein